MRYNKIPDLTNIVREKYNQSRKDFGVGANSDEATCNAKGYYLVVDNYPTVDTTKQKVSGSSWTFDSTTNTDVRAYTVVDIPLDALKTKKIELSAKKYQASRFVDVAYMSTTFQADKASQEMIVSVLSAGAVPAGFYWVDVTNVQVAMTFTDLQGLSGTILGSAQIAFDLYQTEKTSITAIVIDTAGTYPTYTDAVAALDAIVI